MNTYIMMFDIANIVSGGPIYGSNKIRFLNEKGWNVVLFPTNSGNIYIEDLKKYNKKCFSFIHRNPYDFSDKYRKKLLYNMIKYIDLSSERIIIETGTDYTAYWGEILAKEINAKHYIYLLDEYNENINKKVIDFWLFKHSRKELLCINPSIMKKLLKKYKKIEDEECYSFKAFCTNSVKDYKSEFTKIIKKGDYTIGTIGRLDKIFIGEIINGICAFAKKNENKKISFCCFGGAEKKEIAKIKKRIKAQKNIKCFISGYMWPLPIEGIKKCDLFISGAGSAKVSANLNIPTIAMDVLAAKPIGVIVDRDKSYLHREEHLEKELEEYIDDVLIKKEVVEVENIIDINDFWKKIYNEFDIQLEKCIKDIADKEYYDIAKMMENRGVKKEVYRKIVDFIGYKNTEVIRKLYCKLK